jgi:hypothetical protein
VGHGRGKDGTERHSVPALAQLACQMESLHGMHEPRHTDLVATGATPTPLTGDSRPPGEPGWTLLITETVVRPWTCAKALLLAARLAAVKVTAAIVRADRVFMVVFMVVS